MATEAAVVQALRNVRCRYFDMAKGDIVNALSQFTDLVPTTDNYVFSDGSRRPVVALNGTIPVNYRGATYNIPVCLYILDTHPYHPPIPYVKPTATMAIKVSEHVDNSGRIYLPYLHEWRQPQSDLTGLLQIMAIIFSENCPVFSRSAGSSSSPGGRNSPGLGPAYPPYPSAGGYMPMPPPPTSGGYAPFSGGNTRTPYPPYPGGGTGPTNAPYSAQPSSGITPPAFPTATGQGTTPYPPYGTQTNVGSSTITSEHLRLSLESAVQDKIRRKLYEQMGGSQAVLQTVKNTREELTKGEQKLKAMVAKLQQEQTTLESAIIEYREKSEEIDRILASVPAGDELDIDEAIDTTAPLYRQLLKKFAEDNAIEDAVYFLGEALRKQVIDTETYLKVVRSLARKQFMLRATMMKCRKKAGLD